jgi:SSS family solute:Na+ symporter
LLFLVGIGVTLATVGSHVEGGLGAALADGAAAGKFRFFDFDTDPTKSYTFWAALIAATWGGVGSYGTDQLMAQRLFCCKDARSARNAILGSIAAMGVTFFCALVGIGLWAYYRENPMSSAAATMFAEQPDRIFPIFITEVIPAGFKGLAIAGAFAAAISSLDSIMAALSQTTLSALYLPRRRRLLAARGAQEDEDTEARHTLRASRVLVLVWGVLLCAAAIGVDAAAAYETSILDLALTMASYTGGALVAGFFLAFLPTGRDGSGFLFSGPLSVLVVFAIKWHEGWARWTCVGAAVLLAGLYLVLRLVPDLRNGAGHAGAALRMVALLGGLALMIWIAFNGTFEGRAETTLAFPWLIPAGSAVAFGFGWLLARPLPRTSS